uniref:ORF3 n=1 Tax=Syphacia muris TaxID=451379 RepID=A0A0N5AZU5_9BILA
MPTDISDTRQTSPLQTLGVTTYVNRQSYETTV